MARCNVPQVHPKQRTAWNEPFKGVLLSNQIGLGRRVTIVAHREHLFLALGHNGNEDLLQRGGSTTIGIGLLYGFLDFHRSSCRRVGIDVARHLGCVGVVGPSSNKRWRLTFCMADFQRYSRSPLPRKKKNT